MSVDYNDFVNRYRIRDIKVGRDYDRINYGYNSTAYSYSDREETIDLEIPRRSFEQLVDNDFQLERMYQSHREEAYLRKQHSAIAEAYSKYKMLLELYK
jgi:hypothetical protein